ncbi:TPA: hypothetical protein QDB04_002518 [Burkholderia vietnamiensis]|nr:hypothetical protein [Burkholderia vietnamiensis]
MAEAEAKPMTEAEAEAEAEADAEADADADADAHGRCPWPKPEARRSMLNARRTSAAVCPRFGRFGKRARRPDRARHRPARAMAAHEA